MSQMDTTYFNHNRLLKIFNLSLATWLCCLVFAQLLFVTYLLLGYGYAGLTNGWSTWNQLNNSAYIENDVLGNSAYALHVLLAIVMLLGGSMQVVPAIRNRFRRFHRFNGRLVVTLACIISLAGIYLILARGTVGNALMHGLTLFSGIVILISSFMSVRAARQKNFTVHKIWAIRLYLAANGVLFFRLLIFAWFMLFGDLGVNTEDFTGITVVSVSVCSYILPLLIAEWVRYVQVRQIAHSLIACSCLLFTISAIFLIGVVGISLGSWYPSVFS